MMIVTIAALVMAASLGWFAYRLLQQEQRRADARVALLTAALDEPTAQVWDSAVRPAHAAFAAHPVTPAAVPSAPTTRPETPGLPDLVYLEDDARPVQSFRSEHDGRSARSASPSPVDSWDSRPVGTAIDGFDTTDDDMTPSRASGLFAEVPEVRRGDARGAIALVGVVLVGLLVMGYFWFGRSEPTTPATGATATTAAASTVAVATPGGMPLELLSLSHDQRKGTIVVRGLVRNPVSGSDRTGLVASVMLLDQAGGFLGSGRAPLETPRLRAGDDVGFAVELPSHKDVRRYRVTFRGVDGALVPHADRRAPRP